MIPPKDELAVSHEVRKAVQSIAKSLRVIMWIAIYFWTMAVFAPIFYLIHRG